MNENDMPQMIPYVVHESEMARLERTIKRLFILCVLLILVAVGTNAFIAQGLSNEVDALYNRLNSCPVPTTPVYGRTPIFTCNNNGCGCGCGVA